MKNCEVCEYKKECKNVLIDYLGYDATIIGLDEKHKKLYDNEISAEYCVNLRESIGITVRLNDDWGVCKCGAQRYMSEDFPWALCPSMFKVIPKKRK